MPPFPSEEEIAIELIGHYKAREWKEFAKQLEFDGFPPIDLLFDGRFWPAVKRWLSSSHGITDVEDGALPTTAISSLSER